MEKELIQNKEEKTEKEKYTGIKWGFAFTVIALFASLGNYKDLELSSFKANTNGFFMALLGTILCLIRKRHNYGHKFKGEKVIEIFLFSLLVFFLISYIYTGLWSENTLTYFIVPVWGIVAYLLLVFKKNKK